MTIEKTYDPSKIEKKWFEHWKEKNLFGAEARENKAKYTVVIPPPNVTGILHIGHVLNNTIQDIYVRFNRMLGKETLWVPGTDHAGIATQNVVERELKKQGITKEELGREKFVEKVQQWKDEKGGKIIEQLKELGASCDWKRECYTMDEEFDKAVRTVFIKLYEKGLIYRGNYIINWCPRCETALADDEVEHEEHGGNLWHIKYPVKDSDEYVIVATTRPETMLGDTAVAVHPDDERFKHLIGKTLILPLAEREIPIIPDSYVNPEFGTGCVKVTPAHDPNDFEMGERHNLEKLVVMDENAVMNENAGIDYKGLDRYEAREKIINDLEDRKLLHKTESHNNKVGHCYRCNTVIEPYLSNQWFVKMQPLAEPAIKVVEEGKIKFYPDRWTKVYFNWMRNIRDWCISRQLWWGHRIPIWFCQDCGHEWADLDTAEQCPKCGSRFLKQDENVLDTWFSSWLWPFGVFGWPENTEDLKFFFPTDLLVTAPGIIFFWVARMIMASLEFMNEIPFHSVYLHGMVLDSKGRKMSKSLGNSPDPLEVIEKFGADALRFSMIFNTPVGESVMYSDSLVETGRNFANKIWNAARYLMMNLEGFNPEEIDENSLNLEIADKWILHKANKTAKETKEHYKNYRESEAAHLVYDFFWHDFCDWYIEISKIRLYDKENEEKSNTAKYILWKVLNTSLRFLHPFMPFITEEIWHNIPHLKDESESCMTSDYPEFTEEYVFEKEAKHMEFLKEIITGIRNVKAEMDIPVKKEIKVLGKSDKKELRDMLEENISILEFFVNCQEVETGENLVKPEHSAAIVLADLEIYIPLEGLIDLEAERDKLEKEIERLQGQLQGVMGKLSNENFVSRAPKHIVEKEKEKKEYIEKKMTKLKENLSDLD